MKNAFLAALAIVLLSTQGQAAPASNEAPPSLRDEIRADRAKAKAEFENGPKERPWDRDADGTRPWDRKEPPRPKDKE